MGRLLPRRIAVGFVLSAIVCGLCLVYGTSASATAIECPVTLNPTTVAAGGTVQVSVTGCKPLAAYAVYFADAGVVSTLGHAQGPFAPDIVLAKNVQADSNGNFQTTVTIPQGAPQGVSAINFWETSPILGEIAGTCAYVTVNSSVSLDLWDPIQSSYSASLKLVNALKGDGMPKPTAGPTAAHHIIPAGEQQDQKRGQGQRIGDRSVRIRFHRYRG